VRPTSKNPASKYRSSSILRDTQTTILQRCQTVSSPADSRGVGKKPRRKLTLYDLASGFLGKIEWELLS
ncbi:hypothetical protein XENOCAPTIV_021491, partial [Xenoophorus captivus]